MAKRVADLPDRVLQLDGRGCSGLFRICGIRARGAGLASWVLELRVQHRLFAILDQGLVLDDHQGFAVLQDLRDFLNDESIQARPAHAGALWQLGVCLVAQEIATLSP